MSEADETGSGGAAGPPPDDKATAPSLRSEFLETARRKVREQGPLAWGGAMNNDPDPADDGDKVGYGRPPKHTQFKPGQSGNRRGRPKASKNVDAILEKELDEVVTLREGGRPIRITKRQALIKQFVNSAIKGSPKAQQMMLAHLEKHRELEPFVSTEEDDAELLRALSVKANEKEDADGES